tara:strand:- start:1300 stop:1653 length:354 start_codon:yes stop_codon:yes gene_type:complete
MPINSTGSPNLPDPKKPASAGIASAGDTGREAAGTGVLGGVEGGTGAGGGIEGSEGTPGGTTEGGAGMPSGKEGIADGGGGMFPGGGNTCPTDNIELPKTPKKIKARGKLLSKNLVL